jgi:hypothetical protein
MCFCSAGDDSDGGYYGGNALPTDARGRGLLYFELVVTVLVVVF